MFLANLAIAIQEPATACVLLGPLVPANQKSTQQTFIEGRSRTHLFLCHANLQGAIGKSAARMTWSGCQVEPPLKSHGGRPGSCKSFVLSAGFQTPPFLPAGFFGASVLGRSGCGSKLNHQKTAVSLFLTSHELFFVFGRFGEARDPGASTGHCGQVLGAPGLDLFGF